MISYCTHRLLLTACWFFLVGSLCVPASSEEAQENLDLILTPRNTTVPTDEIQPIMVQVLGPQGKGAKGIQVTLRVKGKSAGRISSFESPPKQSSGVTNGSFKTVTDDQGKVRAFYYPPKNPGKIGEIEVQAAGRTISSRLTSILPLDRLKIGANGYFASESGRGFVPLGGLYFNWLPEAIPKERKNRRMGILTAYQKCNDQQLRDWFAYLKANGINTLRWMLRRHAGPSRHGIEFMEPMDIVGRANPSILEDIQRVTRLAEEYDLYFLVALSIYPYGKDSKELERTVLPHYKGVDLDQLPPHRRRFLKEKRMLRSEGDDYRDPDLLRCQQDYLRDLIPRLKDNPRIMAYELRNEMKPTECDWANLMIDTIREIDPYTPVTVSHPGWGASVGDLPIDWALKTDIDFFTFHIYNRHGEDQRHRIDWGANVALSSKIALAGGLPVMTGEAGIAEFKSTPGQTPQLI